MKPLHLVMSVGNRAYGLGPPARFLARFQQASGCESEIWTIDDDPGTIAEAVVQTGLKPGSVRSFKGVGPLRVGFSTALIQALLSERGRSFSLIHLHGIWTGLSVGSLLWRIKTQRPVVVAAHGSLQPWAMNRSRWKKRIAWRLYEKRNLTGAACLHAVAAAEIEDYRRMGLRTPVAVIPNGVDPAWLETQGDRRKFRQKYGLKEAQRVLLFLSRITPKKGLPMALAAMHELKSRLNDSVLLIAGTDEFNHLAEVRSLVDKYQLADHVLFVGPLHGQAKRDAFAAADVFLLPSYSEGAPLVVLEALAAGVPVITTHGSPWKELIEHHCGWWTEINARAIGLAIMEALSCPAEDLKDMGRRGLDLVQTKYLWSRCAADSIRLYDWLLSRGKCPGCVALS